MTKAQEVLQRWIDDFETTAVRSETADKELREKWKMEGLEPNDTPKTCRLLVKVFRNLLRDVVKAEEKDEQANRINSAIQLLEGVSFCGGPRGDASLACYEECWQCRARWAYEALTEEAT